MSKTTRDVSDNRAVCQENSIFDPDWRDDLPDPAVVDIPLILPEDVARRAGDRIWVQSRYEYMESAFGQDIRHPSNRKIKYLLKRSDKVDFYEVKDSAGNICDKESSVYDAMFTPQAWMTDAFEERCVVFAAAQKSRGKILAGGLGLAMYPQFCFHLQRPIESITIVEKERAVIDLVMKALKKSLDHEKLSLIHIVEGTIEKFLQESADQFDTIYLDTWDNIDPRYLAHVNYLIDLARPRCAAHGQILCWGYALLVDTFIEHVESFIKNKVDLTRFNLDPVLEKFAEWSRQPENLLAPEEEIKKVARAMAKTTAKPLDSYDLQHCFTPFARSYADMQINLARAMKVHD